MGAGACSQGPAKVCSLPLSTTGHKTLHIAPACGRKSGGSDMHGTAAHMQYVIGPPQTPHGNGHIVMTSLASYIAAPAVIC